MLIVYTFVFSMIFKARWPGVTNNLEFAGILFAGLIVYGLFSECISRAPMWVRELGMEWIWRLANEPVKKFKRYVTCDNCDIIIANVSALSFSPTIQAHTAFGLQR